MVPLRFCSRRWNPSFSFLPPYVLLFCPRIIMYHHTCTRKSPNGCCCSIEKKWCEGVLYSFLLGRQPFGFSFSSQGWRVMNDLGYDHIPQNPISHITSLSPTGIFRKGRNVSVKGRSGERSRNATHGWLLWPFHTRRTYRFCMVSSDYCSNITALDTPGTRDFR